MKKGEYLIVLPLSVSAKVLLLHEILRQHIRPTELAKRLSTTPQEVNHLIDLKHTTKIDRLSDTGQADIWFGQAQKIKSKTK